MSVALDRLGLPDDTRAVIICADGLGSSHAANVAVYDAIRTGIASSAGLQVPCPWARGAASEFQGEDVGVLLTLNSEHDVYRWGPLTRGASLVDGDSGFPRTVNDLWDHADVEETRRECRAQIERAVVWGFDVSYLGTHLGALWWRPEFFDVFLELAVDFNLPLSMPDPAEDLGFPARDLAASEGILMADHAVHLSATEEARQPLEEVVTDLPIGVTELHVRPARDHPELRAITPRWAARVGDAHLVTHDAAFRSAVERSGATTIDFRQMRAAQRNR